MESSFRRQLSLVLRICIWRIRLQHNVITIPLCLAEAVYIFIQTQQLVQPHHIILDYETQVFKIEEDSSFDLNIVHALFGRFESNRTRFRGRNILYNLLHT